MDALNSSKLNFTEGIWIGIGSIMGSGILFLPSMTYKIAQSNILLSWMLTLLICIPGLYFFSKIVENVNDDSGIAGFIKLGLGKTTGEMVPILLLGTVIIGMPASCIIASKYLLQLFPASKFVHYIFPYLLVLSGIVTTVQGVKVGAKVSMYISLLLGILGVILIFSSANNFESYYPILPNITNSLNIGATLSASVLAFWAFAGFENLTFLSSQFENPKKDLIRSAFVSLLLCAVIYIGLTVSYALLVDVSDINSTTGLLQLADKATGLYFFKHFIILFALTAVSINMISWSAGVSMAITSAAKSRIIPPFFGVIKEGKPRNAALLLGLLFIISMSLNFLNPDIFELLLQTVSINFLIIYFLALISYGIHTHKKLNKFLAYILGLAILISLLKTPFLLIYPAGLILLTSIRIKVINEN